MEYEEKFRSNKINLAMFGDVMLCMQHCRTSFRELATEEDVRCLSTCGYNVAFVRDVALRAMLERRKTIL